MLWHNLMRPWPSPLSFRHLGLRVPEPPDPPLPAPLRAELVSWLEVTLGRKVFRPAVAKALGVADFVLEGHPAPGASGTSWFSTRKSTPGSAAAGWC